MSEDSKDTLSIDSENAASAFDQFFAGLSSLPPVPNWLEWSVVAVGIVAYLSVLGRKVWIRGREHIRRPEWQAAGAYEIISSIQKIHQIKGNPAPRLACAFLVLAASLTLVALIIDISLQNAISDLRHEIFRVRMLIFTASYKDLEASDIAVDFSSSFDTLNFMMGFVLVTVPLLLMFFLLAPLLTSRQEERGNILRAIRMLASAKGVSKTSALRLIKEKLDNWPRREHRMSEFGS